MNFNPLKPDVEVDDLGLPVKPESCTSIAQYQNPSPATLTVPQLHKLHKLAALTPPAEGSVEESQLLEELGELIGLMNLVQEVDLPKDPKKLAGLLQAFGQTEQVFDGSNTARERPVGDDGLKGRSLLEYAVKTERGLYVFKSK